MIKSLLLFVTLAMPFAAIASEFAVNSPTFQRVEVKSQDKLTFNKSIAYEATYEVVERIQQYTQQAVDIYEPICESPFFHASLRWPDFRESEEDWAKQVAHQIYGLSTKQAALIYKVSKPNEDSMLKEPVNWFDLVYKLALVEKANPSQLSGITYAVAVKHFEKNIQLFGFHASYANDCSKILLENEMLYVPTNVIEDHVGYTTFDIEIDVENTTLLPGEKDMIRVRNNDAKTEIVMVGDNVAVIPAIEIEDSYYNSYDFETDMENPSKIYVLAIGQRNKVAPTSDNLDVFVTVDNNGYFEVHVVDLSYNANTAKGLGERIVEMDLAVWEPGQWFPGKIRVFNDKQITLEGHETVIKTTKRAKGGFNEVIAEGVQMRHKDSAYYNSSWSARKKFVNKLRQ